MRQVLRRSRRGSSAAPRRSRSRSRAHKLGERYRTESGPAQAQIWSLREAALGLSTAMKEDAKSISFVEDTAVAPGA